MNGRTPRITLTRLAPLPIAQTIRRSRCARRSRKRHLLQRLLAALEPGLRRARLRDLALGQPVRPLPELLRRAMMNGPTRNQDGFSAHIS
jgi:hypothetical protein